MPKGRQPRMAIDKDIFEGLCHIQCTEAEICGIFHCNAGRLERWIGETYKDEKGNSRDWKSVFNEYSAGGKVSLRRTQFRLAEKSAQMAIFLGKQYLGQAERTEMKVPQFTPAVIEAVEKVACGRGYINKYDVKTDLNNNKSD